jgi:MinD-like ATPase involved in chromosome partitioning or flagellar assembly
MARIISIHSFRGGTGKSNLTANLATLLAMGSETRGPARVGIVDTDIQSPGIHVIFNLDDKKVNRALNDYLWGNCGIEETAYDMSPPPVRAKGGQIYLIPSSIKPGEIARIVREGYDVGKLTEGFQGLVEGLNLDYLLVDTHPGLNEETLLSVAISDTLILILRPDRQDYQGTAVTVEVSRKLGVPQLLMVVNKVLPSLDFQSLTKKVEDAYNAPVAAVLPETAELLQLASSDLFCLRYPDHLFTKAVYRLIDRMLIEE